jgi:Uma2 family endonuclease
MYNSVMTIAFAPRNRTSGAAAKALPTLADLLEDLGGISPARIVYRPGMSPATEKDVVEYQAKGHRLFELVDGVLVEKAMGLWESFLAGAILAALHAFVAPRKLGKVSGEAGMLRLFPNLNLIRMPDVAYISRKRLEDADAWGKAVPQLAPDLAVEVISEGNTAAEMERKRDEYFKAGVLLVWIVNPVSRTVDVYTPGSPAVTMSSSQILDGGPVLPGFTLNLAELFAELDRYPV